MKSRGVLIPGILVAMAAFLAGLAGMSSQVTAQNLTDWHFAIRSFGDISTPPPLFNPSCMTSLGSGRVAIASQDYLSILAPKASGNTSQFEVVQSNVIHSSEQNIVACMPLPSRPNLLVLAQGLGLSAVDVSANASRLNVVGTSYVPNPGQNVLTVVTMDPATGILYAATVSSIAQMSIRKVTVEADNSFSWSTQSFQLPEGVSAADLLSLSFLPPDPSVGTDIRLLVLTRTVAYIVKTTDLTLVRQTTLTDPVMIGRSAESANLVLAASGFRLDVYSGATLDFQFSIDLPIGTYGVSDLRQVPGSNAALMATQVSGSSTVGSQVVIVPLEANSTAFQVVFETDYSIQDLEIGLGSTLNDSLYVHTDRHLWLLHNAGAGWSPTTEADLTLDYEYTGGVLATLGNDVYAIGVERLPFAEVVLFDAKSKSLVKNETLTMAERDLTLLLANNQAVYAFTVQYPKISQLQSNWTAVMYRWDLNSSSVIRTQTESTLSYPGITQGVFVTDDLIVAAATTGIIYAINAKTLDRVFQLELNRSVNHGVPSGVLHVKQGTTDVVYFALSDNPPSNPQIIIVAVNTNGPVTLTVQQTYDISPDTGVLHVSNLFWAQKQVMFAGDNADAMAIATRVAIYTLPNNGSLTPVLVHEFDPSWGSIYSIDQNATRAFIFFSRGRLAFTTDYVVFRSLNTGLERTSAIRPTMVLQTADEIVVGFQKRSYAVVSYDASALPPTPVVNDIYPRAATNFFLNEVFIGGSFPAADVATLFPVVTFGNDTATVVDFGPAHIRVLVAPIGGIYILEPVTVPVVVNVTVPVASSSAILPGGNYTYLAPLLAP